MKNSIVYLNNIRIFGEQLKQIEIMKTTVNFYENGQVVKSENFKTKSEAKKEIEKYRSSVTIKKRVKNGIQAHILN